MGNHVETKSSWLVAALSFGISGLASHVFAPYAEAKKLVKKAQSLLEAKQFVAALSCANRAVSLNPNNGAAYMVRATIYRGMDDLDLAADDANTAIRLLPRSPAARLARAKVFEHRNLIDEAIRDLQIALQDNPEWFAGYLELAQMQVRGLDYETAVDTLRDLSRVANTDEILYDALIMAGWIYEEKLKDLDAAIALYSRAIPLLPDRKIGYMRRAYAYNARGDVYQATEDLLRGAQRLPTPEDAGQYYWLQAVCYGRRYTLTGEHADKEAWVKALENSINDDAPVFSEQARQWLRDVRSKKPIVLPPVPQAFLN